MITVDHFIQQNGVQRFPALDRERSAPAPTPADALAENEEQEFRHLSRIVDAVTHVLPDADVEVRREQRAQRRPSLGCTVLTIAYAAELNGATVRRGTIEQLRNALVALAAEFRDQRASKDQASELRLMVAAKDGGQ